jgi:tetratricopeptide (TPR) repeat protein
LVSTPTLTAQNPDDAEYWFLYAVMLDRKARYFPMHVDPLALLNVREEAVDVLNRLVTEFPETAKYRLNLAIAYEKLGDIALTISNLEGAKAYFSSAVAEMQALFAAEPINNLYKNMLAANYGKLGKTHLALGALENRRSTSAGNDGSSVLFFGTSNFFFNFTSSFFFYLAATAAWNHAFPSRTGP